MLFACDSQNTRTAIAISPCDQRICVRRKAWVLLLFCICSITASAQSDVTDGQFRILTASTTTAEDVLWLNAGIQYSLSGASIEALTNGVPLTFETEIALDRVRRFLPDPTVVSLVQRRQLTFHALTKRFVVKNLNSSELSSYDTLSAALGNIGRIEMLPVIDLSLLDLQATYAMKMHSSLDTRSFPAPLRILAALFQVDDWRLESERKRWLVRL